VGTERGLGVTAPSPRSVEAQQRGLPQTGRSLPEIPWAVHEDPSPSLGGDMEELRARRCPRCLRVFLICRSCDRGHVYCSRRCSERARRESLRIIRRRHARSPEGRLDTRDRQRAWRRRQALLRRQTVTDPTSPPRGGAPMLTPRAAVATSGVAISEPAEKEREHDEESYEASPDRSRRSGTSLQESRCAICGRKGWIVPWSPYRAPRRRSRSLALSRRLRI